MQLILTLSLIFYVTNVGFAMAVGPSECQCAPHEKCIPIERSGVKRLCPCLKEDTEKYCHSVYYVNTETYSSWKCLREHEYCL